MPAIVFDLESTGIRDPRVIEAAWLRIADPSDLTPYDCFVQRYNPGKPIELGALATHHIMDEDLVGCPPHTDFALPSGVVYLIGYNIDYDWTVIGQPDVKRICLLALCRHFFPSLDSHTQSALLYHFARNRARDLLTNAHSADQDVQNCLIILENILQILARQSQPVTWEVVWNCSEKARIPTVMAFGKHKGVPIKNVPADYKRWLLGQPDVDPYLAQALRA